MVKSKIANEKETTNTLFVKVKDDARADFVKYGDILISKSQFIEVDEGVTSHRGFAMLEIQS
jgi:hypothetical protein